MRPPMVISHAACAGHAPENTLAGIASALEFGVDAIEIDVRATADGVPILMHDHTVDRTTTGTGAVADLSLDKLRVLDAGGEPVPMLKDVLVQTTRRALLVIEIKQPGIEDKIATVVQDCDAISDVMVWSFYPQALRSMRQAEPRIPAGLLIGAEWLSRWPEMRELTIRSGLQAVSVFFPGIDEHIVRDCQRSGLGLYSWTVDSETEMERLIRLGVDGICSNYPDKVMSSLRAS